ncbi:TetR/AcrR family transcriptional regulator [Amnibacterium flavum]|uniref:HTH tetR-type domain-containing protein n=1 Tax=Amnibacterium flavum TaxID=2173173 RepID=A0A2V1HVS2_9MICO|nr:TetR/AcrR family transcriptional regulator [Amnibacterium flavum]PVZ94274.1 hypothetical protein DDQ50_11060 [Amnibacterium flavum]
MDPRFKRSRDLLRAAVYELAGERPITEVSVSDLCRRAGVSRDTFYRHASSPLVLLTDSLAAEVMALAESYGDLPARSADGSSVFDPAERALLSHIAEHATVYRNALQPQIVAPLRASLEGMIRASLLEHVRRHPEILPDAVRAADEQTLTMLAAYAASGTVGAIEIWLAGDDLDVDRGSAVILAASPEWWHGHPID